MGQNIHGRFREGTYQRFVNRHPEIEALRV